MEQRDVIRTLPLDWYLDPAVYEEERLKIFGREWNCVGFDYQVETKGDYFTEDVAGSPIFVTRGNDGVLRAFHNVCPHRAGPIVWDGEGNQGNLVCRYHGWAYKQTGELLSARDFQAPVHDNVCLTPVQVDSWRGMIFVNLDLTAPPLLEWLGTFPETCEQYPMAELKFFARTTHRLDCNWKIYADNFLEGYHVPPLHPELNQDCDGTMYRVIVMGDRRWNIHVAPPRNKQADKFLASGVYAYFWPNFSFDVFPGGFATERWLPRGPRHTDVIFDYFFTEDNPNKDEIFRASEQVMDEDGLVANFVQRNYESGAYNDGFISMVHENGLVDFRELLEEVIGDRTYRATP
jgi:choline monooxygenase